MKANLFWKDQLKDKTEKPLCIYDVAFHPNGNQIVLGAGNLVQVYDVEEGKMIHNMNAHKDVVHSVAYARDGKYFASGSADKNVIIWTDEFEGRLKYSHGDGVQCLAFNPVSHQLLSCATVDISLWSPEQRVVARRKTTSRVCSCSWTNDGQFFALGLFNGYITVWTKNGDQKVKIDRPGENPVFALAWNPSRSDHYDILSVCDWGQKLSFYQLNGRQIGKEQDLGFDACFFTHAHDSDFVMIGGSNKKVSLFSKEGLKLGDIGEEHDSWVWSCAYQPQGQYVVLSCADGVLECYQVTPSTVHGLYKDKYAFREGLTDVIIQHLMSEEQVRLKCRDLVKKIAVYKNKLAVQLSEKIVVYELTPNEESGDMTYTVKFTGTIDLPEQLLQCGKLQKNYKFPHSSQCSLLVMCSENVVVCLDRKLQCFSPKGEINREWDLDSQIRYIKVVGGPSGKEVLLVGLKNGKILKVFLDNPFFINVLKINNVVRCLDLSMSRTQLAIVDESSILTVYDLKKKKTVYQEPNATSVAWNTQYEDMLCYSSNGVLYIKVGMFPAQQQRLQSGQGFVVGFTGSRIFSLHFFKMTATDIPQSLAMVQYLERKMFQEAYSVACLGVTPTDWKMLALEALEGMNLEIAKKAFIRIKEYVFLELISSIEERLKQGETNNNIFLAEIFAYQGKFQEAAKLYQRSGLSEKAVEMYTDLCQFELAKQYMNTSSSPTKGSGTVGIEKSPKPMGQESEAVKKLITKQAEWASTTNDAKTAVEMFLSAGEYLKAILIMFDNKWTQQLIDLSNKLDASQREPLKHCGQRLKLLGEFNYAAEVYEKLQDFSSLASLYAETQQWQKGFDLVQFKPDLKDLVYLPYAAYLVEEDRFEEAQEALSKADRESEAVSLLAKLTETALHQNKFKDASYYHWLQARANLSTAQRTLENKEDCDLSALVELFHSHIQKAEIYYAYQEIQKFIIQPFTNMMPEALFNMARFLTLQLFLDSPPKVSKVFTFLTLAKQATNTGAYKTARYAYDRLQSLLIPARLQEFVDAGTLNIRGKPLQDKEDLLPFCYRCSSTNPLINTAGSCCVTCGEPFVYSFISFEVLPVVQFYLDEDISDDEAIRLIQSDPPTTRNQDGWKEKTSGDVDVLQFSEDDQDPFTACLLTTDESGMYPRVVVDRNMLTHMHWREVVVKKWAPPLRYQYYRSLLPDVQIRLCPSCNEMFYAEDYELHVLCKGMCPFCRQTPPTNELIT